MGSTRNANYFAFSGAAHDATAVPAAGPSGLVEQSRSLSGTGTVYTFSIMYNVPQGFEEQKPYVIAIVQLDEGPRVTAQLTDVNHGDVTIGMRVEMVTRKLREEGNEGQIIYGYKFRPLLQDSTAM
jgi:uncharacterized OB-fold protein